MMQKNYLTLDDEFIQYCKINNIEDRDKLAKKIFDRGFTIEKYGEIPYEQKKNIVEKEVVKEVVVEKIVEIVKEIPVQIKDTSCDDLKNENDKLKQELEKLTQTLERFNKATYMKNSDLNNLYKE